MDLLKRLTVCKLIDHDWARIRYPVGSDGEAPGFFLRCLRCSKEDHDSGTVPKGATPIL